VSEVEFDKNCYATPWDFYNRCNEEFRFQLDAAAEPSTAKHKKFVTRDQNVLSMTFKKKRIWLNPPYADPDYKMEKWIEWCSRMCHKYGNTIAALILSSTDTNYWHDIILQEASEIRNIQNRIWFELDGVPQKNNRYLNSLVIFRPGITGARLTSMSARL